jgi:hypothetical protein
MRSPIVEQVDADKAGEDELIYCKSRLSASSAGRRRAGSVCFEAAARAAVG